MRKKLQKVLACVAMVGWIGGPAAVRAADLRVIDTCGMTLVKASVDDVPCTLIVDTGASHTTLDLGFVTNRLPKVQLQEVQLMGRTNVTSGPKFAPTKKLVVGEATFATEGLMALDLAHLTAAVGQRVDGILGMNHLREKPCVLSLRRQKLLWNPSKQERKGFRPVLTRDRGTTFELVVKLPDGRIEPMLVDTGSTFTFLNKALWPAAGEQVAIKTADVNASSGRGFVRGQPGELDCGKGFKLAATPMLTEEKNRNQVGFDVFKKTDILIEGKELRLR